MKMRISAKLMLTAVLGVLAAMSVVSFAAYRIARDSLRRGIVAHLGSVAQSRAKHVQTFLREHKERIGLMATSPVLATGLRSLEAGGVDGGSVVQDLNDRLQSFLDPDGDIFEAFL